VCWPSERNGILWHLLRTVETKHFRTWQKYSDIYICTKLGRHFQQIFLKTMSCLIQLVWHTPMTISICPWKGMRKIVQYFFYKLILENISINFLFHDVPIRVCHTSRPPQYALTLICIYQFAEGPCDTLHCHLDSSVELFAGRSQANTWRQKFSLQWGNILWWQVLCTWASQIPFTFHPCKGLKQENMTLTLSTPYLYKTGHF